MTQPPCEAPPPTSSDRCGPLVCRSTRLRNRAEKSPDDLPDADLIVDALLGFGLSGPPSGPAARLIAAANAHPAPILAVDLPSGLDARTGDPYEPCIRADATLTLALPKTGLLAPAARPVIGELAVADIGIPAEVYDRIGVRVGPVFAERSIVRVMGDRRWVLGW